MLASTFIGRVGTLAATLGVGVAVAFAASATAAASPASDGASADTASTPPSPGRGFGSTRATPGAGPRRAANDPVRVAPSAAVPVRPLPAAARVSAPVVAVAPPPAAAVPASAAPAAVDVVAPAVSAPAAAEAPVMTAARASAAQSVFSPLSGAGNDPLVNSPVSWMVLAVARRQTTSTTLALPAAVVRTPLVVGNQPPVITRLTAGTPNATSGVVTGTTTASDPNRDAITYSATTSDKGTVLIGTSGAFTYTPTAPARHAAARVGATTATRTDTVTVRVTDSKGASASKSVTVTIAPKNAAPVPVKNVGTPDPNNGVVTGSITATDADADPLTYSGNATTAKGAVSVDATTGAFTYTPTATARHAAARIGATSAATTDAFTLTVADGYGGNVAVPVTVAVAPKNTAPVVGTPTVGTPNATTGVVTGSVVATDADNDTLTYSAPATTSKGKVTVNATTGGFTYTPNANSRGITPSTDDFTVTVTDGYGGSTPVAVSVPVAVTPPTPVAKINYVFNYTTGSSYWSPAAKAALQASADRLAAYFVVSAPVTLVFDVTAENSPNSYTLASTGSDITGSQLGFFNTIVQNKILTGVDTNGAAADGNIDVNFGQPWSYTDSVSNTQYDFVSTMMHEMMHAYGFISYVDSAGNNGYTSWTKFDSFISNKAGTKVISPSNFKFNTLYNTNLTGGNLGLYFNGPLAVAAYGGPVPLYTPKPWESGSSVSHLDDTTFTGLNAKLMNAMADTGLGIRTLSAVEIGILKDIGYTVNSNPAASALLFITFVFIRRRKRSPEAG